MRTDSDIAVDDSSGGAKEWRLFIFIIVFLFPILSVMVVGGFGFIVWMYQLFAGPPGPPSIY